jgi:hypothetical protein
LSTWRWLCAGADNNLVRNFAKQCPYSFAGSLLSSCLLYDFHKAVPELPVLQIVPEQTGFLRPPAAEYYTKRIKFI